MEEVYVLIYESVSDLEEARFVRVYSSLDSANKAFVKAIKKARKDMSNVSTRESGGLDYMYFDIWDVNNMEAHQINIVIYQQEVL